MAGIESLGVIALRFVCPQRRHSWRIRYEGEEPSIALGSIIPLQIAALSPGFTSTCLPHRHSGQWFVNPSPTTWAPHFSQTKSSRFFVKRRFMCASYLTSTVAACWTFESEGIVQETVNRTVPIWSTRTTLVPSFPEVTVVVAPLENINTSQGGS